LKETVLQTDPKAGYCAYKDEIDTAIRNVMNAGVYLRGIQTQRFESEFAEFVGVSHGIGVSSGTEACMSALRLARGYTGRNKFIKFEGLNCV